MGKINTLFLYKVSSIIIFAFILNSCTNRKIIAKRDFISFATDVDYLNIIDKRLEKLKTFQGNGKLTISNSKRVDSATSIIFIKKPDAIRLESFSFFGQAIFYFTSKDDSFSIFIPKENKFFTGKDTIDNVQKVLPLDISIESFSRYLIGEFKKSENDSVVIKLLEDRGIYKIYFYGEETKVLWFDPEFMVINRCAVFNSDDELISIVNYSKFKEIQGIMLPMSITIKFPYLDARIDVEYEEVTINKRIKDKLFILDIPDKSVVINLDSEKAL